MGIKSFQDNLSDFLYTRKPNNNFSEWIDKNIEGDNIKVELGLKVYRNNLFITFIDALKETYPYTRKLLTDDLFISLAKEFLYSTPSPQYDLNAYGELFPEFLATHSNHQHANALHDFVELEWIWSKCDFLEDDQPLSFEDAIANLNSNCDESIFNLRKSGLIFETKFNVLDLWKEYRNNSAIEEFRELKQTQHLFIWKNNFQRDVCEIEDMLYPFVMAIKQGVSIREISDTELFEGQQNENLLLQCIQVLLKRGWLAGH